MREIKFRAWNKNTNSIVYGTPIFYKDGSFTLYEIKESKSVGYGVINCGRCKNICQYTGLHDKNGNEIYEGDILHKEGFWDIRIEFENGSFKVRNLNDIQYINRITDIALCNFNISEYDVIGNIYENPELLKH